jgi:hypothetical protein
VDGPQDEDDEVEAVLDRVRRPVVGEPLDQLLGLGGL